MIFGVHQSKFRIATLIFYTCIYLPLVRTKHACLKIIGSFFFYINRYRSNCSDGSVSVSRGTLSCSVDLPVKRFGDLKCSTSTCRDSDQEETEACSVCLVEFESQDLVSQLGKCGHVFHLSCIDRWLQKHRFTCPLCRSVFLNVVEGCNYATCTISCN